MRLNWEESLKSVSKIILAACLLAGSLSASALKLKPASPGFPASFSYEIGRMGEGGEPGIYPAAYLGYERQVISGIFRGHEDFNGILNFGYTHRGLFFLLRIHDDDIIEGSPGGNDAFTLVLSLEGYPDRKIHWESSGATESTLSEPVDVKLTRETKQERSYLISIPWGSWPLFQYRPYRLQLWVYDNDAWGKKVMRLQETPLGLVLNPPIPGEETALAAGRFFLRPGDTLTLYGELFSPKKEERLIVFRINGREISRNFLLREGRTSFELTLAPGEWREKNLLEWDSPAGTVSRTFDVVPVKDVYIPVRTDQDLAKNAFLRDHAVIRYGRLFHTPYEFFYHSGSGGSCR
ncbi:MAG TPA: hypothetical protein ENL15_01605, partial [Firmicutes bacterium]|nr:hypothetical protein [Bacillota bacterium]